LGSGEGSETSMKDLIDLWIDWNEKRIESHDFCMEFEKQFRKEIQDRIKVKRNLKKKILRQMVRDE